MKPLPEAKWLPWPGKNESKIVRNSVTVAYKKCARQGINPFVTPVVVDIGSSVKFRTFRVGCSPCITYTRGSQMAYWCSTTGGRLTSKDLDKLQGFQPGDVDWKAAGVTEKNYCGMLGNAQSLNVLKALLPHVFYAGKLINLDQFQAPTAK